MRRFVNAALTYALAFNLVFFIQELFLVLPKALTPGLKPTLFHNNHDWEGHHPLENLFQGTGALATVVTGAVFAVWLIRWPPKSDGLRMFVCWMALLGFLEALPQVVIGRFIPQNDIGRAMDYFGMSQDAKSVAAVLAVLAIGAVCWRITPHVLATAPVGSAERPARFVLLNATLPAICALPLIAPFRVPGALIEVLFPPAVALLCVVAGLQGSALWARPADAPPPSQSTPVWRPALALALLLAVFHLVLRPGIRFY